MHFNLKHSWFHRTVAQHLSNLERANVAETDIFGKTCAEAILKQGGQELMASIKAQMS